jgi:ribose 1,5-bisphosphokinase PhnN
MSSLVNVANGQLVLLMLGPGGSGKSTVINSIIAYVREYCDQFGHPFTHRTIVVTAMSGVAATLKHGQTTHSAVGLNDESKFDSWMEVRHEQKEDARLFG